MLVLTRKAQQQIQIGDNITITIVRVKGQSVRVGIEAPRNVRVVRGELQLDAEVLLSGDEVEVNGTNSEAGAALGQAAQRAASRKDVPRQGSSLKQRVALLTERVRDEAFQHERTADHESFNPADHRMELCDHGQAKDAGSQWATSPRTTVPMVAFTRVSVPRTK